MTFARIMRSIPAMPIAERRPPIVVGIRQTSSATSTVTVTTEPTPVAPTAYFENGSKRRRREQEYDRQRREQDGQRDLVRRAAALGALDHRDHTVEEPLAFAARNAHDEPVRQHARAARDGREVAAGLAQHGRGFARDGALVDRRDTFDDLTVGGNRVVGLDEHEVVALQRARLDHLVLRSQLAEQLLGVHVAAHRAQRRGLGLAAAFGDGFGEVREQHREPQPDRDREHEGRAAGIGR